MPAPPVLEIYVVWHPNDDLGAKVSDWLMQHFHKAAYSGLAGGAVEVYLRSAGWDQPAGPPRPLPFVDPLPEELPAAQITVVIPILGRGLARAVRKNDDWRKYIRDIFDADPATGTTVGKDVIAVFPLTVPDADLSGSGLADLSNRPQALPNAAATSATTLAREVAQAICHRIARKFARLDLEERVTVFISHTKHGGTPNHKVLPLARMVRDSLQDTHLDSFFDAHDIQISDTWVKVLDMQAARHALLMVRTDMYAGREWTQREVLAAKTNDIPIVCLNAVVVAEDRGSFLMDHVPVIACRPGDEWHAIGLALDRLVDEALKRALWLVQRSYLKQDGFDWLPVHSPEPVTLARWLRNHPGVMAETNFVIMHPDPPLGPNERAVILDICEIAGFKGTLEILTPRTFATRGGR